MEIEDNLKILDIILLDKKNIDNVLKVVLLKKIGDLFLEKIDVKFFF